jgi:hypothetical protein
MLALALLGALMLAKLAELENCSRRDRTSATDFWKQNIHLLIYHWNMQVEKGYMSVAERNTYMSFIVNG